LAAQNFLDLGSVEYVVPSDVPVSLVFSFLLLLAAHIVEHISLWNGTTVCQGALLAAFAPLGGAWCCFRLRLRLKGG
jgi:hypothetical protein